MAASKMYTAGSFVKKFKECKDEESVKRLLEDVKGTEYVPFYNKWGAMEKIATATMVDPNTKGIHSNTVMRPVLFTMYMIGTYTRITVHTVPTAENKQGFFEDYDILQKEGLINTLIGSCIPKNEVEESLNILNSCCEDIHANKFEPHVFFKELAGLVIHGMNKAISPLSPIVKQMSETVQGMSDEQKENLGKSLKEKVVSFTKSK